MSVCDWNIWSSVYEFPGWSPFISGTSCNENFLYFDKFIKEDAQYDNNLNSSFGTLIKNLYFSFVPIVIFTERTVDVQSVIASLNGVDLCLGRGVGLFWGGGVGLCLGGLYLTETTRGQRPPEGTWGQAETPWKEHGTRHLDRKWHHTHSCNTEVTNFRYIYRVRLIHVWPAQSHIQFCCLRGSRLSIRALHSSLFWKLGTTVELLTRPWVGLCTTERNSWRQGTSLAYMGHLNLRWEQPQLNNLGNGQE